ncbi:hypothetical protein NQT62_14155 [Limnobacter humi]|uniref:Uncharacterized protein n=1 Tax=Limnobacter humi TaxID=1778671 RepID=A0ABT1WJ91_9BURK|nr:hypothetical protein [Limnobacter humi]MCQ8897581.1 hypothetical protein [Limnobacter humi]
MSPAVPGNLDPVPLPLPCHLNGKMRYHLLDTGGIKASSVNKQEYSIALVETLINTRFCIAGLNGLGQKIGMDLRSKIDEKIFRYDNHPVNIDSACLSAKIPRYQTTREAQYRFKVLEDNLIELNHASQSLLQELPQLEFTSPQLAARALLAVLPLNLLSPSAFKAWVDHRQRMGMPWSLLEGPGTESIKLDTLDDLIDVASGSHVDPSMDCRISAAVMHDIHPTTGPFRDEAWDRSQLGAPTRTIDSTHRDVEGWGLLREAHSNDEMLVYEARQWNPGLVILLRSLIPRDGKHWADPKKDQAVIEKFRRAAQIQNLAEIMNRADEAQFNGSPRSAASMQGGLMSLFFRTVSDHDSALNPEFVIGQ